MAPDRFQIAAERAASRYDVWSTLSPSERAAAIYRELRKLDADSVKACIPMELRNSAAQSKQNHRVAPLGGAGGSLGGLCVPTFRQLRAIDEGSQPGGSYRYAAGFRASSPDGVTMIGFRWREGAALPPAIGNGSCG